MKFESQEDSPWKWWQTMSLRAGLKRRMMPITPQVALRRKERVAIAYFLVAFGYFNYFMYKHGFLTGEEDPAKTALHHMDHGKILTFTNLKLEKVQDFDSSEYDNVPGYEVERRTSYPSS